MIGLKSDKIIVNGKLFDGYVYVQDGKIVEVSNQTMEADEYYDYTGKYVSAGFIDLHTHGAGGHPFINGSVEDVIEGSNFHLQHGTTTILPTISAGPFENMKKDQVFAYRYYFFVSNIFAKAESGELPHKCKNKPPHLRMFDFFSEGIARGEFRSDYPADECAKLYNSIIQGSTLSFILCPKEFKHSFTFPSVDYIVDIFKKEKN